MSAARKKTHLPQVGCAGVSMKVFLLKPAERSGIKLRTPLAVLQPPPPPHLFAPCRNRSIPYPQRQPLHHWSQATGHAKSYQVSSTSLARHRASQSASSVPHATLSLLWTQSCGTIVNLRARGKGRKLAWQGDGHETHGRCAGSCSKRSRATQASAALTHTHTEWYGCACYWYPQAESEPATKLLANQPGFRGRGRVVKWEVMYVMLEGIRMRTYDRCLLLHESNEDFQHRQDHDNWVGTIQRSTFGTGVDLWKYGKTSRSARRQFTTTGRCARATWKWSKAKLPYSVKCEKGKVVRV